MSNWLNSSLRLSGPCQTLTQVKKQARTTVEQFDPAAFAEDGHEDGSACQWHGSRLVGEATNELAYGVRTDAVPYRFLELFSQQYPDLDVEFWFVEPINGLRGFGVWMNGELVKCLEEEYDREGMWVLSSHGWDATRRGEVEYYWSQGDDPAVLEQWADHRQGDRFPVYTPCESIEDGSAHEDANEEREWPKATRT